ncbi:MAG: asparagine synthase (glutamine-hydrolyzing) [Ruminococcus sp.]|nr:asparagine synthase (glutamine-hydrolyzing) [Ruminococcus sp.]
MSGICGFTGQVPNRFRTIQSMAKAISHRGSASGFYGGDNLYMGAVSLEGLQGSVYNEDGSLVAALDGRIYNSRELREELKELGHSFETDQDAEVILHGFEQWGEDVLPLLRGAFAFAVYNEKDGTLFLGRDPFGIKPLYYYIYNNEIVFASEIKSIMRYSEFDRRLNVGALDSYLSFGYVLPPQTFFEDVYSLLPGHILWYRDGQVAQDKYWEIKFAPDEDMTEEDAVDMISDAISDSVTAHKGGGNEVGCFLSGGVDSGYLSTFFEGHKTFTISFAGDEENSEIEKAKSISDEVGADHYSETVTYEAFWKAVPKVQRLMDQPVADPSAMAMYFTSGLASKYVKAVVSGEGADELFGGYEAYKAPYRFRNYSKVPYGVRKLLGALASLLPDSQAKRFLKEGVLPLEESFVGSGFLCSNEDKFALLKDTEGATRAQDITKRVYHRVRKLSPLTKMQYLDINMWLAGDVLQRADRMSMAHSLELRLPYLDKKVMEAASKIPENLKVNKNGTKYALRKAAARVLTEDITDRKSSGFAVPIAQWISEDACYDMIKEEFRSPTAQKYFNIDVLLSFLDDHYVGDGDYSRQIWAVYAFLLWYRQHFEEVTTEEITEDAIAEVEALADVETEEVAESSMVVDQDKLDQLFGVALDEIKAPEEETPEETEEV